MPAGAAQRSPKIPFSRSVQGWVQALQSLVVCMLLHKAALQQLITVQPWSGNRASPESP